MSFVNLFGIFIKCFTLFLNNVTRLKDYEYVVCKYFIYFWLVYNFFVDYKYQK